MAGGSLGVPAGAPRSKLAAARSILPSMKQNRFSPLRAFLAFLVLTAALLVQSGCVAVVAAGAAGTGVAWYNGRMDASIDAGIDDVYRASQRALAQLEFAKISESKSAVDAQLVSRTALDKKVEIALTKTSDRSTKVSIRVGVFGDESLSMAILDRIRASL